MTSEKWILLEAKRCNTNHILDYDCMGYADTEQDAMKWREDNADNRVIKYCPNIRHRYHEHREEI